MSKFEKETRHPLYIFIKNNNNDDDDDDDNN